jgi:hypothetical protein
MYNAFGNDTDGYEYHMTPLCYATMPFKYWKGTIKYRFQIVASAFHRGRIKIVYDPSYFLSNEYNTNYTRVIDLAEEREFTLEVGWGQPYPMCETPEIGLTTKGANYWSESPLTDVDTSDFLSQRYNGMIGVYVVNELTSPSADVEDIQINVWVSAGDDYCVFNPHFSDFMSSVSWFQKPTSYVNPTTVEEGEFAPQAGEVETTDTNVPVSMVTDESVAKVNVSKDHFSDVFVGDPVTSLRQIFKRYAYHSTMGQIETQPNGYGVRTWLKPVFPNSPWFTPSFGSSSVIFDADTVPDSFTFSYARMTMLNYFSPAFVCRRGGIRYKILPTGIYNGTNGSNFKAATTLHWVERVPTIPDFPNSNMSQYSMDLCTYTAMPLYSTELNQREEFAMRTYYSTDPGAHLGIVERNPTLEVEFPFQNNRRFETARSLDYKTDIGKLNNHYFTYSIQNDVNENTQPFSVNLYVAAAEDFTLGFFLSCPVAHVYPYDAAFPT